MNLAILLFPFVFGFAELRPVWDSLVEAERGFARTSVSKGTKDAFLSVLTDDSILFRPHAVPGKKWTSENPAPPSQLSWEPEFADIAAAGDLGYTTGPWEVRRTPQDQPAGFGHYVTLWRKQPDGSWKLALDIGIGHDRSPKPAKVDSPPLAKDVAAPQASGTVDSNSKAIAAADRAAASSLANQFADAVRLYRNGSAPIIGQTAAQAKVREDQGTLVSNLLNTHVSASCDLGYTYGTAEFKPADTTKPAQYFSYLRIWKKQKDGSWKIVLDLLSPGPKP